MTDSKENSTLTTEKKLRINWFSNSPLVPTGYGCQTRLNVPRLKKLGYDMSISAFYGLQGGMANFNGVPIYPQCKHPYGQDVIGAHAEAAKSDIIITLMDAWVVQPENIPPSIAWYPWFPIDTEPMSPRVLNEVLKSRKGIVMSKFGERMAKTLHLDVYYIPHSVETKVFKPIDRNESRARLGFPKDKFIIGMVAANKGNISSPRKAFFEQIAAFAAFRQEHKDAILYLHTDDGTVGEQGVNLARYCQIMGLRFDYIQGMNTPVNPEASVIFADQYSYLMGMPDAYMVDIYNAFDVMMLCSLGEGFGIPLIEAQACGCPVITGDWTSMGELCFSGWKIPKTEAIPHYDPFFEAFQYQVTVGAVVDRLIKAYEVRNNLEYRERARDGAKAYDADRVIERFWKPVLEDIEKNLHKNEAS